RRIGTAADAALRRVEGGHPRIERRDDVREALAAGVVEVRTARLVAELREEALEHAPYLHGVRVSHGIRQPPAVGSLGGDTVRHFEDPFLVDFALDRASE